MPGFPSAYSKELWQQARDLVGQGMSYPEVSQATGIEVGNLKMRAKRYNWYVPATALAKAQETLQIAKESQGTEVLPSVTTGQIIAESVEEMGQKGKLAVVKGMLPRLLKTFSEDSPLLSQEIESWKVAGLFTNIFANFTGINRPQTAVQVNISGWGKYDSGEWDGKTYDV